MGEARKNPKGKVSLKKKKGWNPKAIVTPKFKGQIEELKGYVFDLHGLDQSELFNLTIKDITKYVDWEKYPPSGKALRDLNVPIISNPNNPELTQGESTMDKVDKAIFQ